MPARRLTIFDVIVDLVPGIVFLLFLVPAAVVVLPKNPTTPLNSAILLLAIGYTTGRILHSVASRDIVEGVMAGLGNSLSSFTGQLSDHPDDYEGKYNFHERVRDVVDRHSGHNRELTLEYDVILQLWEKAEFKLKNQLEAEEVEAGRAPLFEQDYEYLEHFGHSLLHGENSLYQRYTILSTFYRNLWVALLLGPIIGFLSLLATVGSQETVNTIADLPSGILIGGFILLCFLLPLLSVRWLEFRYRRMRALVNDLYLKFSSDIP